uniref:Uncharacterized protein n=1 Tax=Clastoptera arizonana TaxID=38151 RepID=A0A1B6CRZ2_9HEMI
MESTSGIIFPQSKKSSLSAAIEMKNKKLLMKGLQKGISIRSCDNNDGWTPLHFAAKLDNVKFMKLLLRQDPASINVTCYIGQTPLYICSAFNSYKTLCFLVKQTFVNINSVDDNLSSSLQIACEKGYFKIVKKLIEFGANLNAKDIAGFTPLHDAIINKNINISKYLLDQGADPMVKEDDYGFYPFHYACRMNNLKFIQLLLKKMLEIKDFSINTVGFDGRSPLMLSISSKNIKIIQLLLDHGADPNIVDKEFKIALHIASSVPILEIFQIIYQHTSEETILKYCSLNDESQLKEGDVYSVDRYSLVTAAISTCNYDFLKNVLNIGLNSNVLNCPHVCFRERILYMPVSYAVMHDLPPDFILSCLELLLEFKLSLKLPFQNISYSFIDPLESYLLKMDCDLSYLKCVTLLLQQNDVINILNKCGFKHLNIAITIDSSIVLLILQHSDVLEPINIFNCLKKSKLWTKNHELSTKIQKLVCNLDVNREILRSCNNESYRFCHIAPLTVWCRHVLRNHIRQTTANHCSLFRKTLRNLPLPDSLLKFMNFE